MNNRKTSVFLSAGFAALAATLVGCESGSSSSDDRGDTSDVFVADESNSGSISIRLTNDIVPVGSEGGFRVSVRDVNGGPVANTRVSCNTEGALVLTEPTSGSEVTDGNGDISGTVGCNAAGSFVIACRLPIGANKRDFQTVRCSGDAPDGFTGFDGGTGEDIGGGVADNPDDFDGAGIRINSTTFNEAGQNTISIDTIRDQDCDNSLQNSDPDDDVPADPEQFTSTTAELSLSNIAANAGAQKVTGYSFVVTDAVSGRAVYRSPVFGKTAEVGPGASTLSVLFISVAPGGGKQYLGSTTGIEDGQFSVEFTIFGETSEDEFQVIGGSQYEVDNFDRCS
jgi:hypothetical protein